MIRPATLLGLTLLALGACAHEAAVPAGPLDGATLYRRTCGACHRLKSPREHDAETWRRAVERFGVHRTPAERAAIAAYLEAASK
jgi:cytochrome c5